MISLELVEEKSHCMVIWLIGRIGTLIERFCDIHEEDELDVIANYGRGGVIIAVDNRRFALDYDSARAIKVTLMNG